MNRFLTVFIAVASAVATGVQGQPRLVVEPQFGYSLTGSVYGNTDDFTGVYVNALDGDTLVKIPFYCDPDANGKVLLYTPCNATTPQLVRLTLDPNVVRTAAPGKYRVGVSFRRADQPPAVDVHFPYAFVDITLTAPNDPFFIGAVVSGASLQPTVSPGQIVTIFGSNLGPPILSSQPDGNGLYPTFFGQTRVTFNGVPAPTLFNNTSQINAVVPYAIAGQKTAQVVVSHYNQVTAAFSVPVADAAPGIFTLTQDGRGQGAILNAGATVTINGPNNPCPRGSAITLFATGAGLWSQTLQDGLVLTNVLNPSIIPKAGVSLTIGGKPAQVLYAGAAPYMVSGVLQVNAIVPNDIGSGAQLVVLRIGDIDNSAQQVTLAIQ